MNSEKIIKKIKLLMKDRFFYIKKDLIMLINNPKSYPLVQIYSALTQLIEDKTEYIVDKYGRNGYLVNIDEYYMFQPLELNNEHISIFDRSVPIDYKHTMIELDIKKDITKPVLNKEPEEEKEKKEEEELSKKGKDSISKEDGNDFAVYTKDNVVYKEVELCFNTAIHFAETNEQIPRGDENWYKYCGLTMKKMLGEKIITDEELLLLLVDHIIDLLLFDEKVEMMNYIYSLKMITPNSLPYFIKQHFEKKHVVTKRFTGIILFKQEKIKIMKLQNSKWVSANTQEEKDVLIEFQKTYKKRTNNRIIGFIGLDNKKQYLVYKIKETDLKRNTGSRCDESNKTKKLTLLNEIVGYEKYTKENTKGMVQFELCSLLELLMRHKNKIAENLWFMDFELASILTL